MASKENTVPHTHKTMVAKYVASCYPLEGNSMNTTAAVIPPYYALFVRKHSAALIQGIDTCTHIT